MSRKRFLLEQFELYAYTEYSQVTFGFDSKDPRHPGNHPRRPSPWWRNTTQDARQSLPIMYLRWFKAASVQSSGNADCSSDRCTSVLVAVLMHRLLYGIQSLCSTHWAVTRNDIIIIIRRGVDRQVVASQTVPGHAGDITAATRVCVLRLLGLTLSHTIVYIMYTDKS